jgi:hypothetical protein
MDMATPSVSYFPDTVYFFSLRLHIPDALKGRNP